MTHQSPGTERRLTSAPGMIRTTGRDGTWSPSQTSMQREMAEAPFERVGEPWWHSLALWLLVLSPIVLAVTL